MQAMSLEFPTGPVPLDSALYIERPPIEQLINQEISQPGSVIRIRASRQMGKTSLVIRLIHYAQQLGYRIVYVDFRQADEAVFESLDKFLRWFCANVSRQLRLQPMLDNYWDEDIGSKVSCTIYFQGYLLEQINSPLVLALKEVHRIFDYPKIAQEFLPLLRSWHEEAKQEEPWKKLRLLVVHSTEVYITLNINQSPFNIGLPIRLPEFNLEQIQDLAARHGLDWTDNEARKLMAIVGGHPYLVRLALYYLVNPPQQSLDQLLAEAPTLSGIYRDHLRGYLVTLPENPELVTALKQVIAAEGSVQLEPLLAYKLESMGLVKLNGNECTFSCELYRQYFASHNFEEVNLRSQLEQLQKQNLELQRLSSLDGLTQVANRRYFDIYLEQQWRRLVNEKASLSVILLEIDYFKLYNNTHGHEAGDDCLRRIASTLRQLVNNADDLVARYEGAKFGLILLKTPSINACKLAEKIRNQVKKLAMKHDPKIDGLPAPVVTVSLGVASTIIQDGVSPQKLVQAADEALSQAKRIGGNHTEIS